MEVVRAVFTDLFDREVILKKIITFMVAGLIYSTVVISANVFAAPVIKLDDGVNSVVVKDGDPIDANPLDGVVTFNGLLDPSSEWTVNGTTGLSKPVLGSPSNPIMVLSSVNVSTTGAGSLTVGLTDWDFTPNPSNMGFAYGIGGTTNGIVQLDVYADTTNAEFGTDTSLGTLGPFVGGAYDGSNIGSFTAIDDYSLSMIVSISHGSGNGISSFGVEIHPVAVPVPAAIVLLSTGLIGLAGFRHKKLFIKQTK